MMKSKTIWSTVFLALFAILMVACGTQEAAVLEVDEASEAVSAEIATDEPTTIPDPTDTPLPEPTDPPVPTDEPTAEVKENDAMSEEGSAENIDPRSTRLQALTANWKTDWTINNIDISSILSGGPPRDGIPSVDAPKFINFDEADEWLEDNEPVIALDINGDQRAYPLQILTWHEIANDTVGDLPVVVTFCPLCNSALVFERNVNGIPTEFGVSGLLRNSDLIMYDRQTESLWQQFTGEGIVGVKTGEQLPFVASSLISYNDFKSAFPDGIVLSRDTGHPSYLSRYGNNPYTGYDTIGSTPFLFNGPNDGRLEALERVVTVRLDAQDIDIAYPLSTLSEAGAINDVQSDIPLTVFHLPGTSSALGATRIADAEDVGATGVFSPLVEGQVLTFSRSDDGFVDAETGSTWNIVGHAIEGELAGTQLEPIVHADHFWFSWAAFRPDTLIYAE